MVSVRTLAFMVIAMDASTTTIAFTPMSRFGRLHSALRAKSADFLVGVLGDLHIDPRKMEDYETGRSQFLPIIDEAKKEHGNCAIVSLGDLGESKSVRPEETDELFAGTTECHEMAAEFLGSFGVPYELVGGNHGRYYEIGCL